MNFSLQMRVIHRYLGFFLAGIMIVYALSGIVLIFRDTDFLKNEKIENKQIKVNAQADELGQLLGMRKFKVSKEDDATIYFENGSYDRASGQATITTMVLPTALEKMTHLHKARSSESLFYFNIFFGMSLLFFSLSAFWMYTPKTSVFRKGMYFVAAGVLLTFILLYFK